MADLGDLDNFLKEGNVSNLDWLDVDQKEYQETSALPKQNLDIAPDLMALWSHEDKPSTTYLVPNSGPVKPFPGAGDVHTMGDLSEAHGPLGRADDVAKVTRYALIQSSDLSALRRTLTGRFDLATLQANRAVIAQVLRERGLLGRIYVMASDFPGCHNSPKIPQAFVRRHASDAKFIVAKPQCTNCIHAKKTGSKTNCAVFHKEVVLEVPYTEQLAAEVENLQQMRGKAVQASTGLAPRERIRLAVLSEVPQQEAVYRGVGENQLPKHVGAPAEGVHDQLVAASALTRKRDEQSILAHKAAPIVALIRRELLKGRTSSEVGDSLKVRFSMDDLARTRSVWEPHFREAGLYGRVYSTQDSFNDCHEGADFVAKHNLGVRGIVTGSKCGSCIYNKIGRCMLYGKPLVREAADLYTAQTVSTVIQELRTSGRLPSVDGKVASSWGQNPREQLKNLYQSVAREAPPANNSGRLDIVTAFHGRTTPREPTKPVLRPVVAAARRLLNEGLYGTDLVAAMRVRFQPEEISAAREELKSVFAEQGLQGIFYVDPSAYDDYGMGCEEPARLFRARQVKYAKLGSKCVGCVHNVNNTCSKLGKQLVVEPPYIDKAEQQRAMLASGPATETSVHSLMPATGLSMIAEYQLQNGGMTIEVNEETQASPGFDIVLGRNMKVRV